MNEKEPRAFIAGYGMTEITKNSGISEYQLSLRAIRAALDDAGLSPEDVDGLIAYNSDSSDPVYLAHGLGIQALNFSTNTPWGGGGLCAMFELAALAVGAGHAQAVVIYRGFNGRSTQRYGRPEDYADIHFRFPFTIDYGLIAPAHRFALNMHRYMQNQGLTNEDLAAVTVQSRKYAANNPRAVFYKKPITVDDHQSSAWVSEPVLRVFDCCLETDGGAAAVVIGEELRNRVKDGGVRIHASANGQSPAVEVPGGMFGDGCGNILETDIVAEKLWARSGMKPADMDAAIMYDNFTPFMLMQVESMGFCKPGQAADLYRNGGCDLDGEIPVNTHGGQIGEGYIHGLNNVGEAVRQLRGTADNQIKGAKSVLLTGGPGTPTSGMILCRD